MTTFVPYEPEAVAPTATEFAPYQPDTEVKKQAGRTIRDDLSRQMGLFARHAATGATGIGGAIADFGHGAANLLGANLKGPRPSEAFQQSLTRLGLPQAETPLEKGVGFASQVVGGAMDPAAVVGQTALSTVKNAPKGYETAKELANRLSSELRSEGIKLLPSQAGGGRISGTLEGLGGSHRISESLKYDNQQVFQALARAENKLPLNAPLTREVLQSQVKALARDGYDPVEKVTHLPVDYAFRTELRKVQKSLGTNDSFPRAQRDEVLQEVYKYIYDAKGRRIQEMSGRDAIAAIKSLRQESTDLFHSVDGNKALAAAKEKIAKSLESQIERSLNARGTAGSEMLANFKAARTDIAKNYATQKMLSDADSNTIDASKAASAYLAGTPMTGNLRTIAKAGSPIFRESTGIPKMGDVPAATPWDDLLIATGGAGVAGTGSPLMGGAMAAYGLSRIGARKAVESQTGQKMMGSSGLFGTPANQRMKAAGAIAASPYASLFDPYSQ